MMKIPSQSLPFLHGLWMEIRCLLRQRVLLVMLIVCFGLHIYIEFGFVQYPLFTYNSDSGESWIHRPHRGNGYSDFATDDSHPGINLCPPLQPRLRNKIPINLRIDPPDIATILHNNPTVMEGGEWYPKNCQARQKVAIIIPYRDRWQHLLFLLDQLHSLLQYQQCHYRLFVSEQVNGGLFNKGRVMNMGFLAASRLDTWDCYIFHDVDLLPETDLNLYQCAEYPLHLSAGIDQMRYTLMYKQLVGGVLALTKKHFLTVNGYSNSYWGWGGEDDDIHNRIINSGLRVLHTSTQQGRYKMIPHTKRKPSVHRYTLLADSESWRTDGVNSSTQSGATLVSVQNLSLYTNVSVNVGSSPVASDENSSWWQQTKVQFSAIMGGIGF